ncbi:adenosylcobinamide-GDP ribazoletransferase [Anaerostipes sp.]|uniref:adenosylcobinamide-GDP ribazoletransferase n=1 Tax=Anaerostipes sp. TaxID=1872530 RepID=UPI0025BDA6A2|nr:adenosylcobinamide-GDP ribazoletransferase [Anaerostipes sp.]MBS7007390.1 adenosylcobinamide-GDP ribazoletransferase [Anaerostipes sp.]
MKQLWNSFKIAVSMYSRIPVPKSEWTDRNMKYTLCFFPVVGAAAGIFVMLWAKAGAFLQLGTPAYTAGIVLIPVIVTGGIHLDGFMDTADALASYQDRGKKLEILKDPHCGAFAVIACVCYFTAYGAAASEISPSMLPLLACGFVMSRALSAWSIASFPMAKETGLAASFSGAAHKQTVCVSSAVWTAGSAVLMCLFHFPAGILCTFAALITFVLYYRMSKKQFGGITGDLAGWFLQVCELSTAVCLAAAGSII